MNFWSFLTRPGDKRDEGISINALGLPKLAQAHDSLDSAVSLTIFQLFSRQDSQSHGF